MDTYPEQVYRSSLAQHGLEVEVRVTLPGVMVDRLQHTDDPNDVSNVVSEATREVNDKIARLWQATFEPTPKSEPKPERED